MKIKVNGGLEEASKLLSGLKGDEREKILKLIREKDPELAKRLDQSLLIFTDLVKLTSSSLQELLKKIDMDTLGKALSAANSELKETIFKNLSSGLKTDLDFILTGPPLSLDEVQKCQRKIEEIMNEEYAKNLIQLERDDEEYV